ncbi:MAG: hypothetical protein IAI50_04150 [Candidatus Eremiobacteraeota bacterium]|nr:hypothetical protein [Candidatus Eremiobacteraeota bacterium]
MIVTSDIARLHTRRRRRDLLHYSDARAIPLATARGFIVRRQGAGRPLDVR